MFNIFFDKKQINFGHKNLEEYTPTSLPKNTESGHVDLSTFIVGDYSLLNDSFIDNIYIEFEKKISPLIQISDQYTNAEIADYYINEEWKFLKNKHDEEVTMHEVSSKNIAKARNVRINELKERIPKLQEKIIKRQEKINNLSDKHAKYAIRIDKFIIQLGLPVTILAFIADFFINKEFIQNILYSNTNMINIITICLCLMSDGSMYSLGNILSKNSDSKLKPMYRIFFVIFIFLFFISVVGSIAIRVGSMELTYGEFNSKGVFIGKETFNIYEYALAIISSLTTAVTGVLSLFFSIDKDYHLEKQYKNLKSKNEQDEKLKIQLEAELLSLEQAIDPIIYDREKRKIAEANLMTLKNTLKIFIRTKLALHQQSPTYLDYITESTKKLIENTSTIPINSINDNELQKKSIKIQKERENCKEVI